jgi:hypothetical protein
MNKLRKLRFLTFIENGSSPPSPPPRLKEAKPLPATHRKQRGSHYDCVANGGGENQHQRQQKCVVNLTIKKLNPDSFLTVIQGKPVCTSGDRRRQKDRSRCRDRLNNMDNMVFR